MTLLVLDEPVEKASIASNPKKVHLKADQNSDTGEKALNTQKYLCSQKHVAGLFIRLLNTN